MYETDILCPYGSEGITGEKNIEPVLNVELFNYSYAKCCEREMSVQ